MRLELLLIMFMIGFFCYNFVFFSYLNEILVVKNNNTNIIFKLSLLNALISSLIKINITEVIAISYLFLMFLYLWEVIKFYDENILVKIVFGLMTPLHLIAGMFIVSGITGMLLNKSLRYVINNMHMLLMAVIIVCTILSIFIMILSKIINIKYLQIFATKVRRLKMFIVLELIVISELLVSALIYETDVNVYALSASLVFEGICAIAMFYIGIFLIVGFEIVEDYQCKAQEKLLENMYQHMVIGKTECTLEVDCHTGRLINVIIEGKVKNDLIDTYYRKFIDNIIDNTAHPDDRELLINNLKIYYIMDYINSGINNYEFEYRQKNDDNTYHWNRGYVIAEKDEINTRAIVTICNIQEEKDLEFKATIDALTGLYNRGTVEELITRELQKNCNGLFIVIDIDNFKQINDTFGYNKGDVVLREVAQKINCIFRKEDIVGRIGGDEFVVFLKIGNNLDISKKAEHICNLIYETYYEGFKQVTISASIGIAQTKDGTSFEEIYKLADEALYESKKRGKNTFTIER
ncbi:MAG: hypothetical protein ATN35_11135 [Epulopiscium sp. Nele67-Bin004]|nr:MAG: hypothetical protein ATN35_11135 [Epulopiscium sp. Nele67-Bin004]